MYHMACGHIMWVKAQGCKLILIANLTHFYAMRLSLGKRMKRFQAPDACKLLLWDRKI
ncbi:hypothetical protein KDK_27730 [Dictyobacter kobayashii]|uniref:Uncharacterized protein n=1 Tax=Dictyobacter kobayashii TaxID=2014872 RepID=A0A402AIT0_9CHLR|nr:hypothetical protein KDK_27730 [Dictyobacter kobayashii]